MDDRIRYLLQVSTLAGNDTKPAEGVRLLNWNSVLSSDTREIDHEKEARTTRR